MNDIVYTKCKESIKCKKLKFYYEEWLGHIYQNNNLDFYPKVKFMHVFHC